MSREVFRSSVYTNRPAYADYDAPEKFQAIQGIIITRLKQHPNAICSYSGGADSDIMLDLIERTRRIFPSLPPVKYVFFNTGLEMKATKDHVKEVAEKYGVEIETVRPKVGIVQAVRKHGVPFVSKIMSGGLSEWQRKEIPLSIADEYDQAEDKVAKRQELKERYPKCQSVINFLCCCNAAGEPRPNIQLVSICGTSSPNIRLISKSARNAAITARNRSLTEYRKTMIWLSLENAVTKAVCVRCRGLNSGMRPTRCALLRQQAGNTGSARSTMFQIRTSSGTKSITVSVIRTLMRCTV